MTGFAPFLAGIIADPASDDLRLVAADWLEERGDGDRAEYIRCAVELARKGWSDPDDVPSGWAREAAALRSRCDELLAAHRREWTMEGLPKGWKHLLGSCSVLSGEGYEEVGYGLSPCYIDFAWSRGFRSGVTCRWEEFKPHNAMLRAAMVAVNPACAVTFRVCKLWQTIQSLHRPQTPMGREQFVAAGAERSGVLAEVADDDCLWVRLVVNTLLDANSFAAFILCVAFEAGQIGPY